MKTILDFKLPGDLGEDNAVLIELVEEEIQRCERAQDQLGAGEWLAARVGLSGDLPAEELDRYFVRLVLLWSSTLPVTAPPRSADELVRRLEEFNHEQLALSLARAILVFQSGGRPAPPSAERLAYKLLQPLRTLAGVAGAGVRAAAAAAPRRLGEVLHDFDVAVGAFTSKDYSTLAAAKDASLLVVRKINELKRFLLAAERPLLDEIRLLLGGTFRAFCDACLREDTPDILEQAPAVRQQAARAVKDWKNSTFWMSTGHPIARHIIALTDAAVEKNKEATNPALALAAPLVKVDLSGTNRLC